MAVDAVDCEPVSVIDLPDNREIYRELHQFRNFVAISKLDLQANSNACSKIPYTMEQGIYYSISGIELAQNAKQQGISTHLDASVFIVWRPIANHRNFLRVPCRFCEENLHVDWTRRCPCPNPTNRKPVQVSACGPDADCRGVSANERSGKFSGVMSRAAPMRLSAIP